MNPQLMTLTFAPRPKQLKNLASLLVLIAAQFVIMLDTSILNVALPSLEAGLGLSQTGVAWVVNAYFLAFGGFLLPAGRATDIFGRSKMFMIGAAIFSLASLLAGLAPSEAVLVGTRLFQGLGAAILSPAAMSLLMTTFPGDARAKSMSAWSAASAAGGAVGVVAGGSITAAWGWEWVFFAPLPITILALVVAPRLFGDLQEKNARRRFDAPGALTITAAALAFIYAILAAADYGWASLHTMGGAIGGTLLLIVFVRIEQRSNDPILPMSLFQSRSVPTGIVVGILGGAARVSTFFLVALFLQQILRFAPEEAGLAMVPTSVTVFVASVLLLPRMLRHFGAERTLLAGLVMLAAGLFWLSQFSDKAGYTVDILPGLLITAVGVALSFTPSTLVIASGLDAERSGLASGMASASSQIGGALGVSAFSATVAAVSAAASLSGVPDQMALASGFSGGFIAAAAVAFAAALVAILLLPARTKGLKTSV